MPLLDRAAGEHADPAVALVINVLGMWLVLGAVTAGWGLLLIWLARRFTPARGTLSTFQTIWLGYAGLLGFLQLLSLLLPVNNGALALSLPPALAGFVLERKNVARRLERLRLRPRITVVTACVVIVAWLVLDYAACDKVSWYDTGLYHLQMVKWNAHEGVVKGLANVHMRFGYNNSVHVFDAYVDAYWEGIAAHVANGFLLAVAIAQWFAEIFSARTPRGRLRQVFCLFTLPLLLSRYWTMEMSSLGSDLPTTVFASVLMLELFSLPRNARERQFLPLLVTLSIGAVLVTTKLAGLALFGVIGLVALWLLRRADRRTRIAVLALPVLLLIGWIVRGIITSGWLLYPVFGKLPVEWAVPTRVATDDLGNIKSWSRIWATPPSEVFGHGFWHWFTPWLDNFRRSQEFILLVGSATLLAWRGAFGSGSSTKLGPRAAIAACMLGIVQWFVGAPDLRYGGFLFWLLIAALLAPMIVRAMRDATTRALVVVLALAYCAWGGAFSFRVNDKPPKLWGRLPPAANPPIEHFTRTGYDLLYPATGDQCWDAPLPCSPYRDQAKPCKPGSLGDGFLPTVP